MDFQSDFTWHVLSDLRMHVGINSISNVLQVTLNVTFIFEATVFFIPTTFNMHGSFPY
jgi:hypothetical protein